MSIDTGGPAFPHPAGWRRDPHISDGMSLRDFFAAKAMQSVITQEIAALRRVNEYTAKSSEDVMAEWAYKMAGAMLKAREQE
tara:strand:- start:1062 stop:1307 length:246 start_codon:yes stop_codon:yes gene_type:complete